MPRQSWIAVSPDQADRLLQITDQIGHDPGYLVVPRQQIPEVISPVFRQKCDSAVLMKSTGIDGTMLFVCNSLRVDEKARAIDQEPFAFARLSTGPAPSGVFLHHGDWSGRSNSDLPPDFWQHIEASGIGGYFPQGHIPTRPAGPLSDLFSTSHASALYAALGALRNAGLLP